jgi:hypothetical protein
MKNKKAQIDMVLIKLVQILAIIFSLGVIAKGLGYF